MEDYNIGLAETQTKKPISKKKIFIGLVGLIVVVGIVILSIPFFQKLGRENEVKAVLNSVSTVMKKAASGSTYPVALPAAVKTNENVKLQGSTSFDGTTYCYSGKSLLDSSIQYYIDSSSSSTKNGSCVNANNLPVPAAVPQLEITTIGVDFIAVTWPQVPHAAKYTIQCAINADFTGTLVTSTDATTSRTCGGLQSGVAYYVRVKAINTTGVGPWSPTLTIKTTALSVAPANMTINPVSSTQIAYSWEPVSGAEHYVVEWATDVSFMKNLKTLVTTKTSGTATGLAPSTQYFFHVKAVTSEFDDAHAAFSPEIYASTPN